MAVGLSAAQSRLVQLTLTIRDTEVITEIEKYATGPERDRYATGALRLGAIALRQARGELDSASIRQAGQDLIHDLRDLLVERGTKLTGDMAAALRRRRL